MTFVFNEASDHENEGISDSYACNWDSFSSDGLCVQLRSDNFCFILLSLILSCLVFLFFSILQKKHYHIFCYLDLLIA